MPVSVVCPDCQRPAERMPILSEVGWVDYYRCDACGHIYTVSKGTTPPIADVPLRTGGTQVSPLG